MFIAGGSYEAKSVGRVSLQQIVTRSSQRRTDSDLKVMKSRPSRARPVRVQENQAHVLLEVQDDSWITCQQTELLLKPSVNVSESGRSSVGVSEHKAHKTVPTTPGISTRTEFDIVTPKQEDIMALQEAGAAGCGPNNPASDGPGSQHTKPKGKCIYSI